MVQTRIEERMELIDQEIVEMKKEMSKIPAIEFSRTKITKNLELMQLQSKKQQRAILRFMETVANERSMMSERSSESMARESQATSPKENKPSTNRETGSEKADKKSNTEDNNGDRNKFKKVEMLVFNDEDPDLWLFHTKRYFQIHKLSEFEKIVVSTISFKGPALNWYRSQEERNKFLGLGGFEGSIINTFSIDERRINMWKVPSN
ncbi:transposon Tf2-1 polyprotein isoform X1 [Cucumis melo var. makuwa]|uniref:Transposon Tf2-1 polyprotein isoform X1 n=1 Tax=Cucumis melo var. makuwa TaxID=1194695 RepID=A0A5D3D7X3_CUCMM|nr:transposon Tf2-1 polyprotein isoform X1 [Cucumis melo var. makuwa]